MDLLMRMLKVQNQLVKEADGQNAEFYGNCMEQVFALLRKFIYFCFEAAAWITFSYRLFPA